MKFTIIADKNNKKNITSRNFILKHNEYLVIATDSTFLENWNGEVNFLFAENGLPSLNNSGDSIKIIDPTMNVIDSLFYTSDWGEESGVSLEKNDPESKSNNSNNWGLSNHELGGTPGFLNSITLNDFDLTFVSDSTGIIDSQISPNDEIKLFFTIKNIGKKASGEFKFNLFLSENDSIFEYLVTTKNFDSLGKNQSLFDSISIKLKNSGINYLKLELEYDEDQNQDDNNIMRIVSVGFPAKSIVINEIMYNPETGKPEWFEVANNLNYPINLQNWFFRDNNNTNHEISITPVIVPADSFAVITNSSNFASLYENFNGILIETSSFPTLNNSGDSLILLDLVKNYIDSLAFTSKWGDEKGVSLERKSIVEKTNFINNWTLSKNIFGSTPGFSNSTALKDFDLTILNDSTKIIEKTIFSGDTINLLVTIKNIGKLISGEFSLNLYISENDSIFENLIATREYEALENNHSFCDTITFAITNPGINYLKVAINYADDQNMGNNNLVKIVPVGFSVKSMVINEIMYNPETEKPEWFEVANISDSTINIQNWLFRDSQNTIHEISTVPVYIPADSFAVITNSDNFTYFYKNFHGILLKSISFPTLNNSGDSLILLDPVENYIDSLAFSSDWGNEKGFSLERKSTEEQSNSFINWSLSQNEFGSTPGYTNSIALKDFDLAIDTVYLKSENILHNQDAVLVLRISNNGSRTINKFDLSLNIYDNVEKKVVISEKYMTVNKVISAGYFTRYEVELPTISGGVHPVVAKIYALKDNLAENNESHTNIHIGYADNSIVVNEIMYSPETGEAEWIELFNTTNIKIDMNNWKFKDLSDKTIIFCDTVKYIQPDEFLVIASNNEFYESFPDCESQVIIPENFPTLNNTSDGLIFHDASSHKIDSVYYMKNWGGAKSKSIERRNPFIPAIAPDNWGSCEDTLGGTPGFVNSILKYDYDLMIEDFTFINPVTKPQTENYFSISIKNSGIYESGNFSIKIYNDKNYDDYTEEEELVWSLANIPSLDIDSIATIKGKLYSENSGRSLYIAKIVANSDENLEDNTISTFLKIEFEKHALVLNEFLFAPDKDQTEFLECINNTDYDIVLQGWELSNEWHSSIIDFDTKIPSGQYVIFCEDSSIFENYPPFSAPVFILEDWPGMNNTEDNIVLKDLTGKLIDSLQYKRNWGGYFGKSLEKIMPSYPSQDSISWKVSEAEFGATPGKFNSISPYVYDLQITDMKMSNIFGTSETLFDIVFFMENIGLEKCENVKLQIFDIKFNSKSLYRSLTVKDIESNCKDSLSMQLSNLDKGYHKFLAQISWDKDQNMDNDTTSFEININFDVNDLYISEFMIYPKSIKSKGVSIAEYVEVYNPLKRSIYINNWKISDINTADNYKIISMKTIPAESYFVIANDSTIFNFPDANKNNTVVLDKIPSFNNDQDKIVIFDATGSIIDSIAYNSTWKIEQGTAKEKIFMLNENTYNNWRSATSPQGGTPGIENSVVISKKLVKTGLKTFPNPFTPNGDGVEDEVGFQYQLSYPSANIRIDIYDLTGRLIASPVENLRVSSKGVVYWDGTNKYGDKARVGMYISRITATDANSRKSEGFIATFILAK